MKQILFKSKKKGSTAPLHIFHMSKSSYQQRDLKAAVETVDAQMIDVKLGFFYTVLVLAVSVSNIILKRTCLAKKRDRLGSMTVTGSLRSPGAAREDKRN